LHENRSKERWWNWPKVLGEFAELR